MTSPSLFDLLPALHKLRDAGLAPLTLAEAAELRALTASPAANPIRLAELQPRARGPLQSILMLLDEQLAVLADDLDQLYDDQFIETCAPWVIPYLGDLIGYQPVHGVAPTAASPRAEVAHTVSFRRRKGTILTLEQLARDATGWPAHATEQFQTLAATQSLKHLRPSNHSSPNLRDPDTADSFKTPFDRSAHTVDVRSIALQRGRHNLQNIAVFLWSITAHPLTRATAAPADTLGQLFRFNPLGADIPLFSNPISQGSTISTPARPLNVPARLRRRTLCQDLQSDLGPTFYGEGNSLALYLNGTLLSPYQVQVANLAGAEGSWANIPTLNSPFAAAIDPELGRIALPPPIAGAPKPTLQVSFSQGFPADLGGGEYPRADTFAVQQPSSILPFPDTATPARYTTLQDALTFAAANMPPAGELAVEIVDSRTYPLNTPGSPSFVVGVPAGCTLELRARDGHRPTLQLTTEMTVTGGFNSTFQLNGLLLAFAPALNLPIPAALIHAPNDGASQLAQLTLVHCTLVPGLALLPGGAPQFPRHGTLLAELPGLQLTIDRSILGPLQTAPLTEAFVSNSIVDANDPTGVAFSAPDGTSGGGALTLTASTVIGKLHATLFTLVSNSILRAALAPSDPWPAPVWADRKQQGCVRFSALPAGTILPRQFECVEPLDGVDLLLFHSLCFGTPGYAQLLPGTCDTIRRGADDSGELGAFHLVMAPMRETDLRVRLQEYLPVGLECGLYYAT